MAWGVLGGTAAVADSDISTTKVPVPGGWEVAITAALCPICPDAITLIAFLGMDTA